MLGPNVISDKVGSPKASALALEGDSLRMSGNYARATVLLTQALEADPSDSLRTWVYAHLGASWLGLGNLKHSVTYLRRALTIRPNYGWARAHKGEAFRVYARDNLAQLRDNKKLWPCIAEALTDFEAAAQQVPNSPWLMAHYGATLTLAYFAAKRLPDIIISEPGGTVDEGVEIQVTKEKLSAVLQKARNPENFAREAQIYFDKAIELNPSYAWALAFQSFMLVLRSGEGETQYYKEALAKLGQAQLSDANKALLVRTYFFKITSYLGRYDTSVETAFQALGDDPLNVFAPYFIAIGLRKIAEQKAAEKSPEAATWQEVAKSSARGALNALNTTQALVNLMQAGLLDSLNVEDARVQNSLRAVLASVNLEAIALLERDPMLQGIRQKSWFQDMESSESVRCAR